MDVGDKRRKEKELISLKKCISIDCPISRSYWIRILSAI
jgi:hypothetical protein